MLLRSPPAAAPAAIIAVKHSVTIVWPSRRWLLFSFAYAGMIVCVLRALWVGTGAATRLRALSQVKVRKSGAEVIDPDEN